MKISNIVGYMLGNENHVVVRGDQWCDAGEQVYICANKEFAKAMLEASHNGLGNILWTTIYRVYAQDINVCGGAGLKNLLWTTEGNKIIVDAPVLYRPVQKKSQAQLLRNAQRISSDYFKIAMGTCKKGRRK